MPDEAAEKDVIAALFEEFPQLERELRESGLSLDDKDVRETVLITAKVFTDHLTERTNRIRSTIALELDHADAGHHWIVARRCRDCGCIARKLRSSVGALWHRGVDARSRRIGGPPSGVCGSRKWSPLWDLKSPNSLLLDFKISGL